jgi:predicted metalloprotease with PDZ domain
MLQYKLRLAHPSTHLFEVEISIDTDGTDHIDIEFPAWSPGRYFIYDFARNVQELHATDEHGKRLATEKIAKGTWRVRTGGATPTTISYRMFGDTLSGTFSQLDDRHASVNGSSVFGYIVGRADEVIALEIEAPTGWKAYTSMPKKRRGGRTIFYAGNYDVLIDSPIEVGTPMTRKFTLDGINYHIIIDIAGAEATRTSRKVKEVIERFVGDTEKTVRAYVETFGRPEFDDYYFLVNFDPYAPNGDGMEHLASTRLVMASHITDEDHYNALVGVMSHEFFHIWNVKRMRPAELGPFDYTREHHTTLLWVAEGFTQYYGHLMLSRAGVWDEKQLFKELASELNAVDRSPGRFHRNLRESSFDTWHAVGARNPMGQFSNFKNTYVNYYYKGAVVAFMLDLEIRRLTNDRKSLDDVVRELYRTTYAEAAHGEYYLRGSGYTEQDVYDAVRRVAGKSLRSFLRHAVESAREIDYTKHLKHLGLEITRSEHTPKPRSARRSQPPLKRVLKERQEKPQIYTGLIVPDAKSRGRESVTVVNVIEGSAAAQAGLSAGDIILAIDGERVDGRNWDVVFGMKRPGDTLSVTLFRGARLLTIKVPTEERDIRPLKLRQAKDATAPQKRARRLWMHGK